LASFLRVEVEEVAVVAVEHRLRVIVVIQEDYLQ
jgi:hypothetical protein